MMSTTFEHPVGEKQQVPERSDNQPLHALCADERLDWRRGRWHQYCHTIGREGETGKSQARVVGPESI
jgi:hypothetical protein